MSETSGYAIFLCNFVGTFPKTSLLRSWTHRNPGTELFLFRRAGSNQAKTPTASPIHQLLLASYTPPSRKLNTPE